MLSTLIQILKAIHNIPITYQHLMPLYVIYFDTNFESYSQLEPLQLLLSISCMLSTLIQILKAIHNYLLVGRYLDLLYVIYFDTNFESYSQPISWCWHRRWCCMLSTLIQILKAIHNSRGTRNGWSLLYVIYFDTNFESYSQPPALHTTAFDGCMLSTLIQILKAIHNDRRSLPLSPPVVCYLLRYKFCSQFDRDYVKDHIRWQNYKKIWKKANLFEKY